ncbi:cobalamin biosynthesis protein, partial [Synechococcus sp. BA-132 BA5]|uniref:cobalamin biosynthesis protein n=1 Tax=Synechococcus sp. BA-132 BA5 TaxID=3110252 RepID=UPI002B21530A
MSGSQRAIVGLGFGPTATPMLQRLAQAGLLQTVRGSEEMTAAAWLAEHWGAAEAVVAVGACGLVTRLIAPLINDKNTDPAVLVVDPQGHFVVPLLGGHAAGGDRLSKEIAALIGGEAVLTGASAAWDRLPLDAFGLAWGWRRGGGDWRGLMVEAARGSQTNLRQESGNTLWQSLEAADTAETTGTAALVISPQEGDGCRWHPPALWLGLGCERDTSLSVLERLVTEGLAQQGLAPEAVAGLASIDRKGDEPALLGLAEQRGWPLRLYDAPTLAEVAVPHPSEAVAREMGTPSVAEAAALQAASQAGGPAHLLLEKRIERAGAGEQ